MSARAIGGVLVLGAGRALQMIAGLVTLRVATEIMPPETLGYVAQTTSIVALLCTTMVWPVNIYIGRGLLGWLAAGVARRNLLRFSAFVAVAAIASGLLVFLARSCAAIVAGVSASSLGILTLLYVLGYSFHTASTGALNLLGHRLAYVAFGNLALWSGLVLALSFYALLPGPETWLLGLYLGYVIGSSGFLRVLKHSREVGGRGSDCLALTVHAVFAFAWPQIVTSVLWWLQSQSYRFVLGEVGGPALVGLLVAGYTVCSGTMQAFETLFHEIYGPKFYRSLADQGQAGLAKAWNEYASAYLPTVVLFGAFLVGMGPILARVLLGEQYHGIIPVLFLLALTEMLRASSSALYTMGVAKLDMRVIVPPVLVGAILSPFLVYVLGSIDSLLGTAAGMFLAYLGVFLVVIPISRRTLPIRWPIGRILGAGLVGLPMIILGQFLPMAFDATLAISLLVVAIGVLYLAGAQYVLARPWLEQAVRFDKRRE